MQRNYWGAIPGLAEVQVAFAKAALPFAKFESKLPRLYTSAKDNEAFAEGLRLNGTAYKHAVPPTALRVLSEWQVEGRARGVAVRMTEEGMTQRVRVI